MENLFKQIQYLTEDEIEGRISGSKGAKTAADYLAEQFSQLEIKPAGEDGYFSYLDIYAARLNGEVVLSVGGNKLKHRIDFGEITNYSNPNGNRVSGPLLTVHDGEEIDSSHLNGKVVLIPKQPDGFDLASTVEAAKKEGILALLIESGEPRWFHKGIQGSSKPSIPVFRIRNSTVLELASYEGQQVEISLPLISETLTCQNVLGMLPGIDSSRTLVLSAHYDHVGDDPNGLRFPGAVDNASGVAIILQLAQQLAGKTLPFNILFAFFTGEESGLQGAKYFLKTTQYPISAVINVDSLGFEPDLVKMRIGHRQSGNWLADLSAEIIAKHGVEVAWISGGEDSLAFQHEGIPAIGLGQKPTDPTQRGIHSPEDNLKNLFMKPVEKAYRIVEDIIQVIEENPAILSS